jgi:hypothetical protein
VAQIPDYTALGQTPVPTPSYRRPFVDESASGVDQAIAGFGQTLEKVGDQQYARDANLARAQSNNAFLDHKIAVETLRQNVQDQVATGQLPYQSAHDTFNAQVAKIPVPQIDNLDQIGQMQLERGVKDNVFVNQLKLDNTVELARKNDFKDQFTGGLDRLGKLAGMPGADVAAINSNADTYRPFGREAGIPAVTLDKALDAFKDQNWLNQATQRSMEAKDSLPALRQLQHDLTDEGGFYAGKLDTDKRNIVLGSVINSSNALQNRIEREQDKREIHGQMALNRIDQQIASGVPATPQLWSAWQDAVKGTSAEPEFDQRLKEEQTIQDVLRQPPDEQQAYVQQRQQQLDSQGGSVHDKMMVDRLAAAVKVNTTLMQTQPLVYEAQRNGADMTPLDLHQMGTPDGNATIAAHVTDRVATLTAMRTQYGPAIPMAPLLPQEVGQMTSQLQNATPAGRMQVLTSLHSAFNNEDAYQAAMRQIAPHSPVTAIAGSMLGSASATSNPAWYDQRFAPQMTDVERVFRGEGLLNAAAGGKGNSASLPSEASSQGSRGDVASFIYGKESTGLRETFADGAGNLFRGRPDLAETHYSMFKDAFAAILAEKGTLSAVNDWSLKQQALKIALGNTINFNGDKVAVPPGMDPTQFKGYVNNAVGAVVKSAGGQDDWAQRLNGYRLQELGGVGTGRYTVMDGQIPFVRPDGKGPLTIDLRNQYGPAAPPAPDQTKAQ